MLSLNGFILEPGDGNHAAIQFVTGFTTCQFCDNETLHKTERNLLIYYQICCASTSNIQYGLATDCL